MHINLNDDRIVYSEDLVNNSKIELRRRRYIPLKLEFNIAFPSFTTVEVNNLIQGQNEVKYFREKGFALFWVLQ